MWIGEAVLTNLAGNQTTTNQFLSADANSGWQYGNITMTQTCSYYPILVMQCSCDATTGSQIAQYRGPGFIVSDFVTKGEGFWFWSRSEVDIIATSCPQGQCAYSTVYLGI